MSAVLRIPAAASAALCLLVGLTACGGGAATGSASPAGEAAPAEANAFPATVKHKFGETKVSAAPKRVVSLGYSDQDTLLALGVTPVTVRAWQGMAAPGKAAGSWALDKIKGTAPQIYDAKNISPEAIAAMKPDLIVAIYSGIDRGTYDSLSKIAPVIAQTDEHKDYQQPWQQTTRQIGQAVGRPAEADRLVKNVEEKVTKLAAKHPEWKDRSLTVATFDGKDLSAFATKDARSRFFASLGFTPNAKIDAAAGEKFYAPVSLEESRMLDADVVVWDQLSYAPKGKETVTGNASLAALPAVQQNKSVFLEGDLEKAFGWQTVLSLGYVLDHIEESLTKAVPK